jgi:cell division protein FtsZ
MSIPRKPCITTRPLAVKPATVAPTKPVVAPAEPKIGVTRKEPAQKIRLKIVGIGGAGCNTISYIAAGRASGDAALDGAELIAVNTDLQALQATTADHRIQIGASVTRGLGAGSSPELGARAAQADCDRLKATLQGADIVFLVAGLGGGTGTGAAPVVARAAKEQGVLVLAFVALPFVFEGDHRRQQALAGLEQIKAQADAVVCVPNDKLFKVAGENASAADAFKRGDEIISAGARAIWQLLSRKGLINLDFGDLRAALSSKHCDGVFSFGEGGGANKVREAMKALLENPVMDGGDALARAESVLVSVLGGPDMTLADVQRAVEQISRLAGRARIVMGAAIDDNYRERLRVTVIASANILPRRSAAPAGHGTTAAIAPAAKPQVAKKEPAKPVQEDLPLQNASRGKFDKSEPTLCDGQDLDVPTFLRRGIALKD